MTKKAIITTNDGREATIVTKASNVLFEDGQTAQDILNDRQDTMITPIITTSTSMSKVGQGDSVDYSENVVDGAYESCVLKGNTKVNLIQEPSGKDVVLPYEFEDGQYITINDTKESGALGIELKGQTLVNLCPKGSGWLNQGAVMWYNKSIPNSLFKPNTKYFLKFNSDLSNILESCHLGACSPVYNHKIYPSASGCYAIMTTNEAPDGGLLHVYPKSGIELNSTTLNENVRFVFTEYQEGMENWDIPYFEGMQSVQAPSVTTVGKNLLDLKYLTSLDKIHVTGSTPNTEFSEITSNGITCETKSANYWQYSTYPLKAKPNTKYSISYKKEVIVAPQGESKRHHSILLSDSSGSGLSSSSATTGVDGVLYVYIGDESSNGGGIGTITKFSEVQLEESSTATTYEPYKSTTLTTPEEVVLRGIGDVKDTINLQTGELTQRIGEVVLDGSQTLQQYHTHSINNNLRYIVGKISQPCKLQGNYNFNTCISDNIKTYYGFRHLLDGDWGEGLALNGGYFAITLNTNKLSEDNLNGVKTYLQQNPITVQYELATPITKKLSLTFTNQDNQPTTKLPTYNTTTHINTSSKEGSLLPILSHSNPTYPVILKPSTKYSIVADSYRNEHTNSPINFNLGGATASTTVGNRVTTVTTPATLTSDKLMMSGRGNKLNNVMVIEGDVVGDEPYFEGICDCKSPILSNVGENLFTTNNMRTGNIAGNSSVVEGNDISGNWQVTDYIPVKPLIEYYHSTSLYKFEKASFYDINKKIIYGTGVNNFKTRVISTPHQCAYVRYVVMKDSSTNNSLSLEELVSNNDIVVAQGNSNIAYEPYKSNILSCETYFDEATQSDKTIVLRSLPNGVCDTLNVETGEYVQRIGEVLLDGSKRFGRNMPESEYSKPCVRVSCGSLLEGGVDAPYYNLKADGIAIGNTSYTINYPVMAALYQQALYIYMPRTKIGLDATDNDATSIANKFNDWLSQNPITVQYELATPIVSTIDIQGFPHAYKDGHVQLSSGHSGQSLTPKVEYSVATSRNGQIRSNQKMVEKHQKELDRLQAVILANLINSQYQQTLTTLNYELSRV